jgi:hypothetical protein
LQEAAYRHAFSLTGTTPKCNLAIAMDKANLSKLERDAIATFFKEVEKRPGSHIPNITIFGPKVGNTIFDKMTDILDKKD